MALGTSRRQGQHWIEAIQCLDGCFFVNAEHGRMLRRIQIEPDDVSGLFFKCRIIAGHVAVQSMWLQPHLRPDAVDRGGAQAGRGRHFAAGPVSASVRRFLLRLLQHSGLHRWRCRSWAASLMKSFQSGNATLFKARLPARDGRP